MVHLSMKINYPLQVLFFQTETGHEPVREWLKSLSPKERKILGEDIKTVQFGWPLGMPLIRKLEKDLWEIRTKSHHQIYRIIFTIYENCIVLLHGFIKKSQKTRTTNLELAQKRLSQLKSGG